MNDSRKKWLNSQIRRYIAGEFIRLFLRNLPAYILSLDLLLIFNLFKTTSRTTNLFILSLILFHIVISSAILFFKLIRMGRIRLILRIEKKLQIPHNLTANIETTEEGAVKDILLQEESRYHDRNLRVLEGREPVATILSLVVLILLTAMFPQNTMKVVRYTFLSPARAYRETIDAVKEINIEVTPPRYTKEKEYRVTGLTDLTIPVGSRVKVQLKTTIKPEKAKLVYPNGEIELQCSGYTVTGNFVLKEGGEYRIYFYRDAWLKDTTSLHIIARKDHPPEIKVLQPVAARTVKLDEDVEFVYRASDDYGITAMKTILKNGNEKREIELDITPGRVVKGSWIFNGKELGFNEGDTIYVSLEALDNNQFNGPGRAVSRPVKIEIFSLLKYHHKILKSAELILNTMVDALDYTIRKLHYHEDLPEGKWRNFLSQIQRRISALLEQMEGDPYITEDIKGTYRQLSEFFKSAPLPSAFTYNFLSRLESWIIKIDDILKEQRLQEIKLYQEQINFLKEKLADLINRYRENPSEELLQEIKRLTTELEKKIAQMERYVRELSPQKLPDQFVNSEAYRNITSEKLKNEIERLKKSIQRKDSDSIIKNAEDLLAKLNIMNQQLDRVEKKYSSSFDSQYATMDRLKRELQFISREHKKFLKELSGANKRITRRFHKLWDKKITEMASDIKKQLEPYKFFPAIQRMLQQLQNVSESKDITAMESVLKQLSGFSLLNKTLLSRWKKELNNLKQQTLMPDKEASYFLEINRRFTRRIGEINKQLKALDAKHPGSVGKTIKLLDLTTEKLRKAEKFYQNGKSTSAEANEIEAQKWLDESIRDLDKQQQSLKQRKQLLSGSSPQPYGSRNNDGNGSAQRQETVKIPSRKHGISSRREKILKGIKEGFPRPFKSLNRDYFNELME